LLGELTVLPPKAPIWILGGPNSKGGKRKEWKRKRGIWERERNGEDGRGNEWEGGMPPPL